MASAVIHLAIAKELEKYLQVNNKKDYYLGSIAPNISKQIGEDRDISHFIINTKKDIPNITIFVNRYPNFKLNSFNLGYFIHLYTDKLWFQDFLPNIVNNDSLKLLNGTTIRTTEDEIQSMIYSDYTNINIALIENHNMDLSMFYEEFILPKTTLTEIPTEKLDILIDKMGIIIENSKEKKAYTFDINKVEEFINYAVENILLELKNY